MQEREVAVLGETKEQRRVETQKAPPGRMREGDAGKEDAAHGGSVEDPCQELAGLSSASPCKGIASATRYWSWHSDELLEWISLPCICGRGIGKQKPHPPPEKRDSFLCHRWMLCTGAEHSHKTTQPVFREIHRGLCSACLHNAGGKVAVPAEHWERDSKSSVPGETKHISICCCH